MSATFLPFRQQTAVAALLLPVVLLGALPQSTCGCGKGWMVGRAAPVLCSMSAGECQHAAAPAMLSVTSCCHRAATPCGHQQQTKRTGVGSNKCRQIVQVSTPATARIEVAQVDSGHDAALAALLPTPTSQPRETAVLRATPAKVGGTQDLLILLQRLLI